MELYFNLLSAQEVCSNGMLIHWNCMRRRIVSECSLKKKIVPILSILKLGEEKRKVSVIAPSINQFCVGWYIGGN